MFDPLDSLVNNCQAVVVGEAILHPFAAGSRVAAVGVGGRALTKNTKLKVEQRTMSIVKIAIFTSALLASSTFTLGHAAASAGEASSKTPRSRAPSSVSVQADKKSKATGAAVVTLAFDDVSNLGSSLSLSYGKQTLVAKDDGVYPDTRANDGKFAVGLTLPKPVTPGSSRFTGGEADLVTAIKWKVKFKFVACPADCKSVIFGTSCWVCVEVTGGEVGN